VHLLRDNFVLGFKPLSNDRYYYPLPREDFLSAGFDV